MTGRWARDDTRRTPHVVVISGQLLSYVEYFDRTLVGSQAVCSICHTQLSTAIKLCFGNWLTLVFPLKMCVTSKRYWPSILPLLLVASVVSCANDISMSIKKTSKSSATVSATSSRYVRLQLEDLDVPESVSVTAVQRDGDVIAAESGFVRPVAGDASYSSDLECLPLTADGDLSRICGRSAAVFPNLFNHTDEKQSNAQFRISAGRWRSVLRLSHRPSTTERDVSSAMAEVCRARLATFVCSVYSPPCSPLPKMANDRLTSLISCRKLCQLARDRCCDIRLHSSAACDWPTDWNCQLLPADRMCDESSALNVRQWSFSGISVLSLSLYVCLQRPPVSVFFSDTASADRNCWHLNSVSLSVTRATAAWLAIDYTLLHAATIVGLNTVSKKRIRDRYFCPRSMSACITQVTQILPLMLFCVIDGN